MKKNVPQKIASRINTKNDIFQKNKDQNQKLRTPMNRQHNQNAITTQKQRHCVFQKEIFSSHDQKLVETTNL